MKLLLENLNLILPLITWFQHSICFDCVQLIVCKITVEVDETHGSVLLGPYLFHKVEVHVVDTAKISSVE